jgi:hypothetical protein
MVINIYERENKIAIELVILIFVTYEQNMLSIRRRNFKASIRLTVYTPTDDET